MYKSLIDANCSVPAVSRISRIDGELSTSISFLKRKYTAILLPSTLRCLASFGDFRENNTETHVALCGKFSGPVSAADLVKSSKDAANLVAGTRKNFFAWGV